MAGVTRQGQELLSVLLKGHRRKFPLAGLEILNPVVRKQALYICMLLRLAAVLNHSRGSVELPEIECQAKSAAITLIFPKGWFEQHPLTHDDLIVESNYLNSADLELVIAEEA
jgi:exopolyphosphatase/guanosine-5'-triphosphate,3'-diphosphate pyrophosphatase